MAVALLVGAMPLDRSVDDWNGPVQLFGPGIPPGPILGSRSAAANVVRVEM
jgi:hypothetical protein